MLSVFSIVLSTIASWNLPMYMDFMESVFLLLGTYSVAFKKQIFSKDVWKYVFVWTIIFWTACLIYYHTKISALSFLETSFTQSASDVQTTVIVSIPALIAIYRLGFAAKKK